MGYGPLMSYEPCMCGGCPKCGVEDRPEVDLDASEVIDLYCEAVSEILTKTQDPTLKGWFGYRTEYLTDLAAEYRDGSYKSRKETEQEDRMMDPSYDDGSDYPYDD